MYRATKEQQAFLLNFVTNTTGPVYAVKQTLAPAITAAAMARLSRCSNDFRAIVYDEFRPSVIPEISDHGKEQDLLRNVLTEYGDDSVQQLACFSVIAERPSNLLTKVLERLRLSAALEQSTRYLFFDQKVEINGKAQYRYAIPPELTDPSHYCKQMDTIFDQYSEIVRKLDAHLRATSTESNRDDAWRRSVRSAACDAARGLLPAATTSTVGLVASAQSLDALIMRLRSHDLGEARELGDQLLVELRKVAPVFFERTDLPHRGSATSAYLKETRDQFRKFCQDHPDLEPCSQTETVKLVDYFPKSEAEIAEQLVYAVGYKVKSQVNAIDPEPVIKAFTGNRLNRRHKPGRMLETAHYTFRFYTPYAEFRDLQRHRMVDAFEWHYLRPTDYRVPDLVIKAGLDAAYKKCMATSAELYKSLEPHGHLVQQYAVAFANNLHWGWTCNAREAMHIIELRTASQGHAIYRNICQQMYEQIKQVHPIIASTIKFVNQDEDPELNRLAAERAAAFKLAQLK